MNHEDDALGRGTSQGKRLSYRPAFRGKGFVTRKGVTAMISKMENMVANSSAIRAMFEEGNRLAKDLRCGKRI